MSMDAIINLEEALGRKFTEQESARLREIGRQLHLRDDDALWSLLAALEYQRIFYEKMELHNLLIFYLNKQLMLIFL